MTHRSGFSLVEMVIVTMIGAMLIGVGGQAYGVVAGQRAARNARDAMLQTVYRARSEAVRSGRVVHLRVRPGSGEIYVESSVGELHRMEAGEFDVTILGDDMDVCYTARGYAMPGCTSIGSDQGLVQFVAGSDTVSARISIIGQVRGEG